jgi:dolichol-phosphate mannosyltransferase
MVDRKILVATVRDLSAMGFKILLDILATAQQPVKLAEVPYTFRDRYAGESKLDEFVIWEYAMLLADKTVGRFIPVRFLSFSLIGGIGLAVHLATLAMLLKGFATPFSIAQSGATISAMVFNFALNNFLTYRDRRLKGAAWIKGLIHFMIACSVGAIANVGIATYLFETHNQWIVASLAGVLIGAVWNYSLTRFYIWGKN